MKADIKVSYRTYFGRHWLHSTALEKANEYARTLKFGKIPHVRITRIVATTTYREEAVK